MFPSPTIQAGDSDIWTTHTAPPAVAIGSPFTVTVGYGNEGPDAALSAYVNSYFPAPMGLDVFIDDLVNGTGALYDQIQATATGTDTLGNAPILFWDDNLCEDLLFQLQRNDDDNDADPVEGLDPGVHASFSYDFTIPMGAPNLGTVEITEPVHMAEAWVGYNNSTFGTAPGAAATNSYGRGSCDSLVGPPGEDICEYIDDNCFGARVSHLDQPIDAEWEIVDDGSADPTLGCDPLVGFTAGNVAVIRRGNCEFGVKAFNAELAGATASIIVNTDQCSDLPQSDQCVLNMAAGALGGLVTIPVIMLAQADGEPIISAIEQGETVRGLFGGSSVFRSEGQAFLGDFADTDPDPDNDSSRVARTVIGSSCSFAVDPTSLSFPAAGGDGQIAVTAGQGCSWQASTSAWWITGPFGQPMTGSGPFDYQVAANYGPGRSAVVEIEDQVHYVTQSSGNGCATTITPTDAGYPSAGGDGAIQLTTQPGCEWNASATVPWMTMTSPSNGLGSTTIAYSVDANTSSARTGAVLVADQIHRVDQWSANGCDGGVVTDDGTPENGYGGQAGQFFVQRLLPERYPHVISGVCASFTRNGGDEILDFEVLLYDDDGSAGGPGTLLASVPAQFSSVPAWPETAFFSVDVSGQLPAVTDGAVYLGVAWDGTIEPGFFISVDESPTTPAQDGHFGADGVAWQPITTAYPAYRSLMLRSEMQDISDGEWMKVVGDVLGGGNGFGDPGNSAIFALAAHEDALFAGTINLDGAEVYATTDGLRWTSTGDLGVPTTDGVTTLITFDDQLYATTFDFTLGGAVFRADAPAGWTAVASGGFGDPDNWSVDSSAVFNQYLYVGTTNDNGCEIWRSPDGASWSQVNVNGFGSPGNEGAMSMAVFDNQLWVGLSNPVSGAELWRSADGVGWTGAVGSGFGDVGNRAVRSLAVFEGALYAAVTNSDSGAQIWRTFDGATWERVVDGGFGNADSQIPPSFQVDGRSLLVSAYGPNANGATSVWISDDGAVWSPDSSPGFGDPATGGIVGFSEWRGDVYAGTLHADGCEVWRRPRDTMIFDDGFESGDTSAWTRSAP
jgi:hypothetical protein